MAIDGVDRTKRERTRGLRIGRPGALDLVRSLVVVGLAIFAILVLLPAVVAAQAAVAI